MGWGVGGPCHIYAYEGIVPAEIFILQYIFPCPPFSINNDLSQEPCLSLIFHSFFLIGLFKIVIAMVVFSVVLLLLIGQFCQGIIIYIKFIVTKNFNSHNPYSGSKFLFVFSYSHFRSITQDCWKVVLFSLLSRSNDLKIPLDCFYPGQRCMVFCYRCCGNDYIVSLLILTIFSKPFQCT